MGFRLCVVSTSTDHFHKVELPSAVMDQRNTREIGLLDGRAEVVVVDTIMVVMVANRAALSPMERENSPGSYNH